MNDLYQTVGFPEHVELYYRGHFLGYHDNCTQAEKAAEQHYRQLRSIKLYFPADVWGVVLLYTYGPTKQQKYACFYDSIENAIQAVSSIVKKGQSPQFWPDNEPSLLKDYDQERTFNYNDIIGLSEEYWSMCYSKGFQDTLFYNLQFVMCLEGDNYLEI